MQRKWLPQVTLLVLDSKDAVSNPEFFSLLWNFMKEKNSRSFRVIPNRSDEGLKLETSAFELFTAANLHHQLRW